MSIIDPEGPGYPGKDSLTAGIDWTSVGVNKCDKGASSSTYHLDSRTAAEDVQVMREAEFGQGPDALRAATKDERLTQAIFDRVDKIGDFIRTWVTIGFITIVFCEILSALSH